MLTTILTQYFPFHHIYKVERGEEEGKVKGFLDDRSKIFLWGRELTLVTYKSESDDSFKIWPRSRFYHNLSKT